MNSKDFYKIIDKFTSADCKLDSILISDNCNTFRHDFTSKKNGNIRSISKVLVCMCIGEAIKKKLILKGKLLTLDTLIWSYFEEKINLTNSRNISKLKKIKLKHLLTHTMGYNEGFLFQKDINKIDEFSLLEYIFNYDIKHEPGMHFAYSNVGTFIISALIQEELGINLSDWINKCLFQKIGILDFEWEKYGKYCAGSTGLKISNADLHKIGLLLLNDGKYNGQQIIQSTWVSEMRTPQIVTPSMYNKNKVFPKYAYGYNLWICKNGNYFCDGNDGQYLIVLPQKNIVITTFGHQSDMKPITECLRVLL